MPSPSQIDIAVTAALEAMGLVALGDVDESQRSVIERGLSQAIDEIATFAPASWWGDSRGGGIIPAPTTDAIGITSGSTVITGVANSTINQAVLIPGDQYPNRAWKVAGGFSLTFPTLAATGTVTADVHSDTVELPPDFRAVRGDIEIVSGGRIRIVTELSSDDLQHGTPSRAAVLPRINADGFVTPHLCFNASPAEAVRFTFNYYRRPVAITSLTDDRNDLCPRGFEHSILVPIMLSKIASISNSVKLSPQSLAENYKSASAMLVAAADVGPPNSSRLHSGWHN